VKRKQKEKKMSNQPLTDVQQKLLVFLQNNPEEVVQFVSKRYLANKLGCTHQQVINATASLYFKGYLTLKNKDGG
jgi:biotin operon repressor